MKISPLVTLVTFSLIQAVRCLVLVDSTVASACIYYNLQFDWGCNSHSNGHAAYSCRCHNINWLGTVTNCIFTTTDEKHLIEKAIKHLSTRCEQKADLYYSPKELNQIYENGTQYLRDSTMMDKTMPVFDTLNVNMTDFEFYHKSFKDYTVAVRNTQWYGWGLVFFWVSVVTIATIVNRFPNLPGMHLLTNNTMKRKLILPSIFKNYKDRTFLLWGFIPLNFHTRLNTLVISLFIAQTAITCCIDYNVPLPNAYLTTAYSRSVSLISYRTDIMSISLFPVIYLFGTRNNPLIPISGISYATFSFYHKWCAYVCTILAFIHSLIWTYDGVKNDTYIASYMDAYWAWGVVAMVLLGLLLFQSEKLFRDHFYETFLIIHKIFNIVFIISMYYHLNTLGWLGWVWSMAGIMIFDRLMRILRVIWSGGVHKATLSACGNDVVKMTMRKPKNCQYPAGSFAYLYFLEPYNFWFYCFQSHPFSVMTDPHEDQKNPDHIVFYFKARKGITKAMLNRILFEGRTLKCNIMIEGPYGTTPGKNLTNKNNMAKRCVGVAAGMGIISIYPYFIKLLQNDNKNRSQSKFYWIINDYNSLTWFDMELKWLRSHGCELKILHTSNTQDDVEMEIIQYDDSKKENENLLKDFSFESEFDVINLGTRPDLNELIKFEIDLSNGLSVDIEFLSCGPSTFNDDFRHSVANNIPSNLKINVDLSEESFTW